MATEKTANQYNTSLASNYTAGSGTLTVVSATGAPTVGNFRLLINNSTLFKVTSVAGAVFTGVAEANDANASSGAVVNGSILSIGSLNAFRADQNRVMTVAQFVALGSGEYQQGDRILLTDGLYEAVRDASAWKYFCGSLNVVPPAVADFTSHFTTGTTSITAPNGGVLLGTTNGVALYGATLTVPYTITAAFFLSLINANYSQCGMYIRDSASHKCARFICDGENTPFRVVNRYSSENTYNSNVYSSTSPAILYGGNLTWARITNDSTTRKFQFSNDGKIWATVYSEAAASYFTENSYGFFVGDGVQPAQMSIIHSVLS